MRWWGRPSSKEENNKTRKESVISKFRRKLRISSDGKPSKRSAGSKRHSSDIVSESLPVPGSQPAGLGRTDSGISTSSKSVKDKRSKPVFRPLSKPSRIGNRHNRADRDEDVNSPPSIESDTEDPADYRSGNRTTVLCFSCSAPKNQEMKEGTTQPKRDLGSRVPNIQVPSRGTYFSFTESSRSCQSTSPMRTFGMEQITSSPSPRNQSPRLPSPGPSPRNQSPRMTCPSSRIQSGAVTPVHPRARYVWTDDEKKSHPLPLPPVPRSPERTENSASPSPSVPRSPGSPGSVWKKGKMLGSGICGQVYTGFDSQEGAWCAMKEVTLFADDPKSREREKQLDQEIVCLSKLSHPNIVQYYGSERVDDKFYIYLEYVAGGSIHKLLQEYGKLGESAIRYYTKQILSGLEYLHKMNTIHRDIKGANILVDPNGDVKLADFGLAKLMTGQAGPLSSKGTPNWMAPEVIKNSIGYGFAVDIWSLGCTVLEMATGEPPWGKCEWYAAMYKISNTEELPTIPNHLSDEGKDFVKLCLQRNPMHRPTAAELLDHDFVKKSTPRAIPVTVPRPLELSPEVQTAVKSHGNQLARNASLESEIYATHSSSVSRVDQYSSEINNPKNITCPNSPIGSPHLYPGSPSQNLTERLLPSPVSSPRPGSSLSTPRTGGSVTLPLRPPEQSI